MARKKKISRKHELQPDFRSSHREKLVRRCRKTVLFNEKEMSLINQFCEKYSIKNKSAFIRNAVISHILEQIDGNYPKLF